MQLNIKIPKAFALSVNIQNWFCLSCNFFARSYTNHHAMALMVMWNY